MFASQAPTFGATPCEAEVTRWGSVTAALDEQSPRLTCAVAPEGTAAGVPTLSPRLPPLVK